MSKKLLVTYLLIVATLLTTMSLSRYTSDHMRGGCIGLFGHWAEKCLSFKHFIFHPTQPSPLVALSTEENYQQLQMEKQLLETELMHWRKQVLEQFLLASKLVAISSLPPDEVQALSNDYRSSLDKALQTLSWRVQALPARVIFRSLDTWSHSMWINVGQTHNPDPDAPLIALNSPVVMGSAIVGIIDYVGQHQSRVRLITDSRLTPSVRASRGGEQHGVMSEQIEALLFGLEGKKSLPFSGEDRNQLVRLLGQLHHYLQPLKKNWYLAKGVLLGSISPESHELRGSGFNYDFADEEGPSRDLLNGSPHPPSENGAIPILKVHDLLVTTGMDGLFPAGLHAAIVTHIEPLKEGDYFYTLRARPIFGSLEGLSLVFVLPPVSRDMLQPFD